MIETVYNFILEQINTNQFFSTAFFITIAGTVFYQLKTVPLYLYEQLKRRVVFTATIYQTDPIFYDFENWFYAKYSHKYRNVEVSTRPGEYETLTPDSQQSSTDSVIHFRQSAGSFFLKYNGKYLLIMKNREKLQNANNLSNVYFNEFSIYGIKAKTQVTQLLKDVLQVSRNKKATDEVKIYSHNKWGDWRLQVKFAGKTMDSIILDDKMKSELTGDVDNFLASTDWYKQASIMYKRGYLFYGSPGNGKTSISIALANYTDRDLYTMDLSSIEDNDSLRNAFQNLPKNAILLIEDIDSFFDQRKVIKKDSEISFSTFINCLDGAFYKEGLITIITTNYLSKLDSALVRTGRMDYKIEIKNPTKELAERYMQVFYGDNSIKLDIYAESISMSDVQNKCLSNKDDYSKAILQLTQKSS